jgi:hypothetical protein
MKQMYEQPVEAHGHASIGHNSNGSDAASSVTQGKSVKALPPEHIAILPAIVGSVEEAIASDLTEEVEILKTDGQRLPVIVRPLPGGQYEAVVRAGLVAVILEHNRRYPDDVRDVAVQVSPLSDEDAFRHAANEIAPASEASSYARGWFFNAALDHYRTAEEVAHVCRVSKAAVSKNLDVYRAVAVLGDKILVKRDVSQRAASWLMGVIGRVGDGSDAPSEDQRTTVLHALEQMPPGSATKVFAGLRASVKTSKPRRNEALLKHKGVCIGTLRPTSHGGVRIDLPNADDVPANDLATIIQEALAALRRVTLS